MNKYEKLSIPKDSEWERSSWRSHAPVWFKELVDSVKNVIRWIPILWQDRDWDDYYITKILQFKIENQREYLVKANRHVDIDRDNKWMTLVLNLLEREHESYYAMEYLDYVTYSSTDFMKIESDELDLYLSKYKSAVKRIYKLYPNQEFNTHKLALYLSNYNQQRCRNLIFEILKRYSAQWWD
jgi:hypothetical protein